MPIKSTVISFSAIINYHQEVHFENKGVVNNKNLTEFHAKRNSLLSLVLFESFKFVLWKKMCLSRWRSRDGNSKNLQQS